MRASGDRRRHALVISPIAPGVGVPSGFSSRYFHFIDAMTHEFAVDAVVRNRYEGSSLHETDLALPEVCHYWGEVASPTRATTRPPRLLRVNPYWMYPPAAIDDVVGSHDFSLAVGFHHRSVDQLASVDRRVPKIAVFEERSWTPPGRTTKERVLDRIELAREARFFRRLAPAFDLIVAISEREADLWRELLPQSRVEVVGHAIDCTYYAPVAHQREFDVGCFGIFGAGRDAGAIRLARHLAAHAATKPARVAFVGTGPSPELLGMADDSVIVTGRVDDMRPWYSRCRVVAAAEAPHPGVKTTVMEAWAMGCAVAGYAHSFDGLPVRSGVNALVARSESELVDAIGTLINDDGMTARLGAAGRKTAIAECNVIDMRARFAQLCRDVAG